MASVEIPPQQVCGEGSPSLGLCCALGSCQCQLDFLGHVPWCREVKERVASLIPSGSWVVGAGEPPVTPC